MLMNTINIQIICIFRRNVYLSNQILPSIINLNEGSHTKLIGYKCNCIAKLKALQVSRKKIRYVWLKNSLYTNMTFARSLWLIISNKAFQYNVRENNPIGISFITNKVDIQRDIYEMYYCYYHKFEEQYQFNGILWGRKYIINNLENYSTIIQEFFSPEIMM